MLLTTPKNMSGLDFGEWGMVDYTPSDKVVNVAQSKLGDWGLDWLFKSKNTGIAANLNPNTIMLIAGGIGGGILLLMLLNKKPAPRYSPRPVARRRAPVRRKRRR